MPAYLVALVCLVAAGTSSLPADAQTAQPDATEMLPNLEPTAALAPGDVIDIKFFNVPELNESQAVRPDGKIALQLVGEIIAQGKTPAQLRQELNALYAPHLKKPDVTVIVRSFQSRRVYVGGEVNMPAVLPMPGTMTALEAIMQAGGFNLRTAQVKNVVIIRHKDGKRYGASLDFRDVLKGKPDSEFELEPLDVVYVPRTKIVRISQWIDQHVNQMIPILGLEYSHPWRGGTILIDTTRGRTFR